MVVADDGKELSIGGRAIFESRGIHAISPEMNQIEHNPHERRMANRIWWAAWAIVAVMWSGQWYVDGFDWGQIALGAFTGMILAAWAIDITGNKVPESWTKPASRR